ncbi:hypothetical protein JY97_03275 [Alkalispirochaeta odontotermitis]|nr:hypothetical protein JY97_03275 [Alkalispirochaeta odontotermitis]CAB1082738.1 hypothetical protein D1AOALGA4SA_10338 [Olavius algarvensis Delta 1 endosymbiont]
MRPGCREGVNLVDLVKTPYKIWDFRFWILDLRYRFRLRIRLRLRLRPDKSLYPLIKQTVRHKSSRQAQYLQSKIRNLNSKICPSFIIDTKFSLKLIESMKSAVNYTGCRLMAV